MDSPDNNRRIHREPKPSFGGVGIFIGSFIASVMVIPFAELAKLKFMLLGLLVIFFMGIRDDISSLSAKHKLLAQVFAATLVVVFSGIRLEGLYGVFGIYEMPVWFNLPFTAFAIIALTNSFNLIDGVDGLAGGVVVFGTGVFRGRVHGLGGATLCHIVVLGFRGGACLFVLQLEPVQDIYGGYGIFGHWVCCFVLGHCADQQRLCGRYQGPRRRFCRRGGLRRVGPSHIRHAQGFCDTFDQRQEPIGSG